MRRKDREITDRKKIESIIHKALICRLAMVDENRPYIVPLCFGYRDMTLYFHSAKKGKKLDLLKKNNRVCFEIDVDCKIKSDNKACEWGMEYKSVIGYGKAEFIEDFESKREALKMIMDGYSDKLFDFTEAETRRVTVFRVKISSMTGKEAQL